MLLVCNMLLACIGCQLADTDSDTGSETTVETDSAIGSEEGLIFEVYRGVPYTPEEENVYYVSGAEVKVEHSKIPSHHKDIPVYSIGDFTGNTTLKSIFIPDTVIALPKTPFKDAPPLRRSISPMGSHYSQAMLLRVVSSYSVERTA